MNFLRSMKVTTKLVAVLSLLLVALLLSLLNTISRSRQDVRQMTDFSRIDGQYLDLVNLARQSQVTFKKQVQEWKDLLLRGNDKNDFAKYNKQFLEQETRLFAQLDEIITIQKSMGITSSDAEGLKTEMRILGEKYKAALSSYDTDNPESGKIVDRMVKGIDRTPTDRMDALAAEIVQSSKKERRDILERSANATGESIARMAIASLVFIACFVVISWLVFRDLSKPLSALLKYSRAVSSGNLDSSIDYIAHNEIGELEESISSMVRTIKVKLGFSQGIMEAITTPCVISDASCKIIFVNQAVIDLIEIGGKPENYIGMNCGEFFYNDGNKQTITEKVCTSKRTIANAMADVTTRKGRILHCKVDAAPVVDLDGHVVAGLALVTDISEVVNQRKLAENQAEKISLVAHDAEGISRTMAEASSNLASQVEHATRSVADQQTRIGEAADAMQEMNTTIIEVAKNAGQAAETAASAKEKATSGAMVVGSVIEGMKEIHRESLGLKDDMGVLGRQAEAIGQIMNVISDIADQTNLLALNAAIEAARAGEAGRGFAVVADEVRKLAEKTMSATKEVGDAIQGIQQGTKKNIESVERSVHRINDVNSLSGSSGESLREIVSLVDRTTDQVRSIATASEEQSASSEAITRSIEDVGRLSMETTDAMTQSTREIEALARQAQEIKHLIATMQDAGSSSPVRTRKA
jgi:methyl-accepting chemotaxis protein